MIGRWDLLGLALCALFGLSVAAVLDRWDQDQALMAAALSPEATLVPGEEWLGVYAQDQKAGYTRTTRRRGPDGVGWRVEMESVLRMSLMGSDQQIAFTVEAALDDALTLEAFDFEVEAGPAEISGRGVVEGSGPDLQLALTVDSGGSQTTRRVALSRPPVLQATLGPQIGQRDLKPGDSFTVAVFDPLTQTEQAMEIEVVGPEPVEALGHTLEATHIRQRLGGLVLDAWLDPSGDILKQQLAMGLLAVRETEAQARWGVAFGPRPPVDLMSHTMVQVAGMPDDVATRPRLALALGGISFAGLDLDGDRQRFDPASGALVIERESGFKGLPRPVSEGFDDTLAASALIQSDHPEIQRRAAAIVGDAPDTVVAARRILAWARRNIRQDRVIGVPSALEVLQTEVGDCNEHSALFAALARAAGVPTRTVAGLVWADGQFGYHAWNEIAAHGPSGPIWLTVDPTWRQLPADVGHLRLVVGDLGRQVELLRAIGQVVITY